MRVRKAVLPVAGLGTRFLPATKAIPKELLPVVDKPLVQYAVEEALAAGVEQFIMITGRGKGALEDHFDADPELEQTLRRQGKEELLAAVEASGALANQVIHIRQGHPLGLGHAVWCARHAVGDEPFAVLLPDDLTHGEEPVLKQMVDRFRQVQSSLVAVMEVPPEQVNRYGILDPLGDADGELVRARGLVEKPAPEEAPSRLAIIGRYLLTPAIFPLLEKVRRGAGGEIQLTDGMAALLEREPIHGLRFRGERFDCGDKVGFQMANLELAMAQPAMRQQLLPFLRERFPDWERRDDAQGSS